MAKAIETACEWAVGIANDNSHGYDQYNRWGPNYDCSSLVISAYNLTIPVKAAGATYTGNMKNAFMKCGFKAIPYVKGMTLIKGDVVVCDHYSNNKYYGHTLLYLGNGNKIVQASIAETGGITGKSGDQTGKEIAVGNFYEYSKGWDYVLRYENDAEVQKVSIELRVLRQGDQGEQVKTLQRLLKELGYRGRDKALAIDGDFGINTAYAVGSLQSVMKGKGIIQNIDYIVGEKTWNFLLKGI